MNKTITSVGGEKLKWLTNRKLKYHNWGGDKRSINIDSKVGVTFCLLFKAKLFFENYLIA